MVDEADGNPQRTPQSEQMITVTCQNCSEEVTNSRAYFKGRDWECPHCGGRILEAAEE